MTAMRILVVEDDPRLRTLLARYLRGVGYVVDEAENGAEALAKMAGRPPDAVLLDMVMPQVNGPEFLATTRNDPRLAAVPVVILSGAPADEQSAKELGARAYLMKPIDLDVLKAVIDRVTRS